MTIDKSTPLEIDVQTLNQLRTAGDDHLLLDVREASEYEQCRIDGSMLVPMSTLAERLPELEPHRHRTLVVHCHHGGRSARVTQYLRQQGFEHAQNLAGGIDAWSVEIDAEVPRY